MSLRVKGDAHSGLGEDVVGVRWSIHADGASRRPSP